MEYLTGYTIKPHQITAIGEVTFTDGTNTDLGANQVTCEAYGYTYDKTSGTCRAFRYNTNLNRNISNINNRLNGAGNTTEVGSNTVQINGTNNTARGFNNSCFINGSLNEIANGVNNASVLGGTYGKAIRNSEIVIGGGVLSGVSQTSTLQLGGTTTDATPTNLTIQSDGSSFIEVQNNSVFGFEIKVIALCSGGSSGTAGDYNYLELIGAIQVDDGYNLAISQATHTLAKIGSTLHAQVVAVTDPYITVEVTGAANVNLEWLASVQITEKKLRTGTF
tara:strand:- start:161 stop:994 length:834 start_codon:yes stop_codon:yes gene_type:complete